MPSPLLYLAPMQGLTDVTFRNTFTAFFTGIDLAVAPFIATVSCPKIGPSLLSDVLPTKNSALPVIPQILGNSAEDFIRMTECLTDLGYNRVNWNLGCPYPRVVKKSRGSGLLPHPDRIDAFLDQVMSDIKVKLSIKTRVGRFDASEIHKLIPIFNRYPISEIIIHPRTGVQMYTGLPDLAAFEHCLNHLSHPVIYNGDIHCLADFQRLEKRFPSVRGWMAGRGVVADPFLPEIIKSGRENIPDRSERFRAFHDALFGTYCDILDGPAHPVHRMKAFWHHFARSFPNSGKWIKQITKTRHVDSYREVTGRFFTQTPPGGKPTPRSLGRSPLIRTH